MKTKFFKVGKRTLSVVLSLMMLASSVFVGSSETVADAASDTSAGYSAADVAADDSTVDDNDADSKAIDVSAEETDNSTASANSKKKAKAAPESSGDTKSVNIKMLATFDALDWARIYVVNNSGTVLTDGWGSSAATTGSQMTSHGSGFSYDLNVDSSWTSIKIIFIGSNSRQTKDITVNNPYSYDFDNKIWWLSNCDSNDKSNGGWTGISSGAKRTGSWVNYGIYLEGRLPDGTGWVTDSMNYPMTKDSTNLYKYDTQKTLATVSTPSSNGSQYFWFRRISLENGWQTLYYGSTGDKPVTISDKYDTTENTGTKFDLGTTESPKFYFNSTSGDGTDSGNVVLWVDTSSSTPKFYYTIEGAAEPEETVEHTIYYDNSSTTGWGIPRAYIYDESGSNTVKFNGEWSSTAEMTSKNSEKNIYEITFATSKSYDTSNIKIIFQSNDGNSQAPSGNNVTGWAFSEGHVYKTGDSGLGYDDYIKSLSQTYTIYYDNSARKLGDVRAYIWSGSGDSAITYNGTYDNTLPMTYDETTHLWYVSGIPSAATGVIFKTGGQTHTDDLVFQGGKVYKWNSSSTSDVTIYDYDGYTVDNAYSVAGRLQMKESGNVKYTYTGETDNDQWIDTINNDFLFTHVSGTTYKFETNCSVAELSQDLGTSSESRPQYFYILDNSDQLGTRYKTSVQTVLNGNNAETHVSLLSSNSSHLYFNDTNFTSGTVVLWFNSSTKEFWYTVDGATKYEATINAPTGPEGVDLSGLTVTLNDNSGTTFNVYSGCSATVKVAGIPTGYTADVTVTKADSQSSSGGDGYSSTGISKKMSKKTLNASGDTTVDFTSISRKNNEYTFTMPESDVTVSVAVRALNTYIIKTAEVDTGDVGTITAPASSSSTATEGSDVELSATVTNSALYNVTWSIEKKSGNSYTAAVEGTDYTVSSGYAANSLTNTIQPYADLKITATFTQVAYEYTGNLRLYWRENRDANAGPSDVTGGNSNSAKLYFDTQGRIFANFETGGGNELKKTTYYFASASGTDTNTVPTSAIKIDATDDVKSAFGLSSEDKTADVNGNKVTMYFLKATTTSATSLNVYIGSGTYSNRTVSNESLYTDNGSRKYTVTGTWAPAAPDIQSNEVTVYAKTGTIRDASEGCYDKYAKLSTVSLKYSDNSSLSYGAYDKSYSDYNGGNRLYKAFVKRNKEITVTIQIKPDYRDLYYVKAFCINGDSTAIINESDAQKDSNGDYTGTYTCTYTVTDDDPDVIEITPIYYYFEKPGVEYITLKVENFAGEVRSLWGNTIACYAYYADGKDTSTPKNALGGYPGQPMVKIGSSYYMQIPRTDGDAGTVKGITLNNYVWDDIHGVDLLTYKEFNGLYQNLSGNDKTRSNANCQTYDYDDFTALAALDKTTYSFDNIVFNFKYRTWNSDGFSAADKGNVPYTDENTTTTKFGSSWAETTVNSTYNGWDVLTDYYDYPINIFGTRITGYGNKTSDATKIKELDNDKKLYIVSDGYENYYTKNNAQGSKVHDDYIGEYGTKWYVYTRDTSGNFKYIAALPPSAFIPSYSSYLDSEVQTAVQKVLGDSTTTDATLPYAKLDTDTLKAMPVVITYESALYAGGRQNAVSRNGLRCDGRWYFSKTNEKVSADVEIHILDSIDENGKITAHKDDFIVENETITNKGTTTNATAYFVDTRQVTDGAISTGDVDYSTTEFFHFQAQQSSKGTDNFTYVFVGWYTESGDGVYNPVNNVEKGYGSELRDSNNTFIAMYKKETKNLLSISHLPLTENSPADASKPPVGEGSGKTYATVRIYEKDADTTTDTPVRTISTTSDEINISNSIYGTDYLNGNYKIVIDLTTAPNDGSVYDSTTNYDSEAEEGKKYTLQTITDANTNTITIEISASQLSTWFSSSGAAVTTKNLVYYSKFNLTTMLVTYHYFDRKNPANETNDIRQDATDVTVKVAYTSKDTPADIIASGLNSSETANGENITTGKLSNILDEYVIWTTQAQASGEEGILGMVNYHDKNGSSYYNYGNSSGTYTDSTYDYTKHTNYIGTPALKTATDTEKWITYYSDISDEDDKKEYTPATGISSEADYDKSQIKEISVWAYNSPKQYPISFVYPKEGSTVDPTPYLRKNTDFGSKIDSKLPSDVYYIDFKANGIQDNSNESNAFYAVDKTFYNQRIGTKYYIELTKAEKEQRTKDYDENKDNVKATYSTLEEYLAHEREVKTVNDDRNIPGNHISLYGVTEGYTNTTVTALSTATAYVYDDQGNKTYVKDENGNNTEELAKVNLVFDGWYDANTGTKITSDADYGYRVTSKLNLVAGYKPAGTTKQLGVSVSENERDYYITQGSDNSLVEKIRFNTQLNVYDSVDNNKDIAKTAAVYVLLKVVKNSDVYTTEQAYNVANDDDFIDTLRESIEGNLKGNKNSGSIDWSINDETVTYAYEVIFTYTNGTPAEDESSSNYLTLNNKNRAEFTLYVNAADYKTNEGRSAILAFGAVKLNSKEDWILSDNCIQYINYTPSETTNTNNGDETKSEPTSNNENAE